MAKIHYKSLSIPALSDFPAILISEIENDASNTLEIFVSSDEFSFVLINEKRHRLSNGFAKIDAQKLLNGLNDVAFIRGTQKLSAEPFSITDAKAERASISNEVLKGLETALTSLSQRLLSAEERIRILEDKTTQKNILNFG